MFSTSVKQKDASGVVYGMNVKFFPQQTLGSPYLEYGSVYSRRLPLLKMTR